VESGTALEITGSSHLHACTTMWDEIFVENGAEITVNQRSLIEDAEDGLHIEDGAKYILSKANFNKNYRHVTIVEPSGVPIFPVNLIDSCLFLCQTTASIGGAAIYTNLLAPRTADSTLHGVWAYDARRLRLGQKDSENYFSNCRFAATAWGVDTVDIQSNTFEDVSYTAISAAECGANGDVINIYDNQINRTPTGIYCYDNPYAATKIVQNRIDYSGMASPQVVMTGIVAIEITPGNISDPNRLNIQGNSINRAPCGIHAMNLFGLPSGGTGMVYIGEDTVKVDIPTSAGNGQAGILIENLILGLVIDNTVHRYNNAVNWWETGIRLGSGSYNSIICNYTHHIGNGLWFDNDQRPFTTLAKNVMENNGSGLLLNNGKIGQQGSSGTPNDNEWLGSWTGSNYGTHCYSPGSNGLLSPFYVQNTSPFIPVNNHKSNGAPDEITVTNAGSGSWTSGCAFVAPSFKTGENEEQRGLADALSILSSEQEMETDRQRGVQWAGEYGLYRALLLDEELRNADDGISTFFSEKDNSSMGQLYRALSDFQHARQLVAQGGGIGQIDHLSELSSLQTDRRPEQRLAEVLGILYSNISDLKGINGDDETHLREIAQLCPIDDGPGVYVARATLLKLDTLPRLYTSECEGVPSPEEDARWKEDEVEDESTEFSVYPNPNNGNMIVGYNLLEGQTGSVSIYSILGELIVTRQLYGTSNQIELSLSNVSSGIYLLNLEVNGEQRLAERLSILKE
jgi:hypothetical protein